ncbi:MAG: SdpI family protein, partial [Anaerolineae bacterium]|nr:SdpI family protein [Anaerolineae bacterium]
LLFLLVGYMLRKAKRNWFIGIRTPWTLSSDTVWDKTHQLAGKLFIASGILAMLGVFFGDNAVWFTLIPILGTTLWLFIYSYLLYQKENS